MKLVFQTSRAGGRCACEMRFVASRIPGAWIQHRYEIIRDPTWEICAGLHQQPELRAEANVPSRFSVPVTTIPSRDQSSVRR